MSPILRLMIFLCLGLTVCTPQQTQEWETILQQCGGGALAGIANDTTTAVLNDVHTAIQGGTAFQSDAWKARAETMATQYGFGALACAVQHLLGDVQTSPMAQRANEHTVTITDKSYLLELKVYVQIHYHPRK